MPTVVQPRGPARPTFAQAVGAGPGSASGRERERSQALGEVSFRGREPTCELGSALVRLLNVSNALAALNRDKFVIDQNVETTVDLDGHHAASDLDELDLGDVSEIEVA
jgi:hypothetical protein